MPSPEGGGAFLSLGSKDCSLKLKALWGFSGSAAEVLNCPPFIVMGDLNACHTWVEEEWAGLSPEGFHALYSAPKINGCAVVV